MSTPTRQSLDDSVSTKVNDTPCSLDCAAYAP